MVHGACQNFRESGKEVFDHSSRGSRHLRDSEEERVANFSATMVKRETRSVKGETKSANFWQRNQKMCEFLARESVNSSPILARQW